jgi:hypothetical protein
MALLGWKIYLHRINSAAAALIVSPGFSSGWEKFHCSEVEDRSTIDEQFTAINID